MAKILADKEVRKLLGTVIFDADEKRINPNGIEIRLGKHVLFQSTDEEKELSPGMYLKIGPGESVTISSLETFNFKQNAIEKLFSGCGMMAFITPTTTMMREGVSQSSTKIDSGWSGALNWGLRNSSTHDLMLGYGEPIFKLTFFLLEHGEIPDIPYGERTDDKYQDTKGIVRSSRMVPSNIPKKNVVSSSLEKLDPAKQLREAGYPYSYISRELEDLHGKWVVVSNDVSLLKQAITGETEKLSRKIDESQQLAIEKVEILFDRKFIAIAGSIIACIPLIFGMFAFLNSRGMTGMALLWVGIIASVCIGFIVWLLSHRKSPPPKPHLIPEKEKAA